MTWLSRWFRKQDGKRDKAPSSLPEDLLEALRSKSYDKVSPALRVWCAAQQPPIKSEPVVTAARACGWDDFGIVKLEIYLDYYGGEINRAFERAKPYAFGDHVDPDLFVICLVALYQNSQFEEAYALLENSDKCGELFANRSDYWFMRALVCWSVNDMVGVKAAADLMCKLAPEDMATLENACGMYLELGDLERFDPIWKKLGASERKPGYAYALNTLALDDYEAGFSRMEARYEMDEAHRYLNKALFCFPRWQGEDIQGKTLLVSAEQGLGDTIQVARYLPLLQTMPVAKIVMETQPETLTLLQYNFPKIEFFVREYAKKPDVAFDYWVGAMSLPHLLGRTSGVAPGYGGYLDVPKENTDYWHERVTGIARGRAKIGLAWSGNPKHRADRRRSVPFDQMMDAVRKVDADFFALQTSVPSDHPVNVLDVSEEMVTLADTAALIAEMDLVISVDTSVVHVAGAIGKRTLLLLPYRYEWRWGLEGESNRWYDSVKVIRQRRHGEWGDVLTDVFAHRLPQMGLVQRES